MKASSAYPEEVLWCSFNSLGRSLHLGKGMGVKSWGVLCLGIHVTWRAGGADAGAAASVLEEKGACLECLTRKEVALRRGRFGICVLVQAPTVPVPKDLPGAEEYAPS